MPAIMDFRTEDLEAVEEVLGYKTIIYREKNTERIIIHYLY